MSYEIKVGDVLKLANSDSVQIISTTYDHPLLPIVGIPVEGSNFKYTILFDKDGTHDGSPQTYLVLPKTKLVAPVLIRLADGSYTFESFDTLRGNSIRLRTKEEVAIISPYHKWLEQLAVEVPDED